MKTVGIISEYNPFHNGHKYHIQAAREACSAEYAVCIMSGSFVQRGEPAVFDKWSRAQMTVMNGADLVIELPVVYACQPAEIFATGAVKILASL
jgi:predicted nucleotidyltransferase